MPASLHNTLILLAHQVVRSLPAPVLGALDAWMAKHHAEIMKHDHSEKYVPNSIDALPDRARRR